MLLKNLTIVEYQRQSVLGLEPLVDLAVEVQVHLERVEVVEAAVAPVLLELCLVLSIPEQQPQIP